jgi:hypothetical protein
MLISEFSPYVTTLRKKCSEIPSDADAGIGYVYIDHDCGVSMKVEFLCIHNDLQLGEDASFSLNDHVSLRFRYNSLKVLNLTPLTREYMYRFNLPDVPEWIRCYETPDLKTIRDFEWLDPFRAHGFFDDVMAILPGKGENVPEFVWVRLSQYIPETDRFLCTLLNEPFRDYGIHRNDTLEVQVMRNLGGISLIVIPFRVRCDERTDNNISCNPE